MTDLVVRSKAPLISADPGNNIVETGFPLARFQAVTRYVQYFKEEQLLPRTNDFKPSVIPEKLETKQCYRKILLDAPELHDISKTELTSLIEQDAIDTKKFEELDPLKGNSLISTNYSTNRQLYLFSSGPSLTNLVVALSKHKQSSINGEDSVSLPHDQLHILHVIDLKYPIRQIALSPFNTLFSKIFIVRTTSSISVFTIEDKEGLKKLDEIILAEDTQFRPLVDYSMPVHVELSPYEKFQYIFITNNGYISIRDAKLKSILLDEIEPIPDHLNYISRWRSCAFGNTFSKIVIASPECIVEWDIKNDGIIKKVLAVPNERILAFNVSANRSLYAFATVSGVFIMDPLLPDTPVITWKHDMKDGLPCLIELTNALYDNWNLTLFSHESQRLSIIKLHYVNQPTKGLTKKAKVNELHHLILSKNEFERINYKPTTIQSVGFSLKTNKINEDREFLSIDRLFEDGSIRVQNIEIGPKPSSGSPIELDTKPRYQLNPNSIFQSILDDAQELFEPKRVGVYTEDIEVQRISPTKLENYLSTIQSICLNKKLTDRDKTEIASKVRQLKTTSSFHELFENESYLDYDLDDLESFLQQLEQFESIEVIKQIHIPNVIENPITTDLNTAHKKKIELSKRTIHPLPDHTFEPANPFHYLNQDIKYNSTTTAKVMANYWSLDDTSHRSLVFPEIDLGLIPPTELFRSVRQKRRTSDFNLSMEDELPIIIEPSRKGKAKETVPPSPIRSQPEPSLFLSVPSKPFSGISTQPLPGAFGSRTKAPAKKKKKAKTSGFK